MRACAARAWSRMHAMARRRLVVLTFTAPGLVWLGDAHTPHVSPPPNKSAVAAAAALPLRPDDATGAAPLALQSAAPARPDVELCMVQVRSHPPRAPPPPGSGARRQVVLRHGDRAPVVLLEGDAEERHWRALLAADPAFIALPSRRWGDLQVSGTCARAGPCAREEEEGAHTWCAQLALGVRLDNLSPGAAARAEPLQTHDHHDVLEQLSGRGVRQVVRPVVWALRHAVNRCLGAAQLAAVGRSLADTYVQRGLFGPDPSVAHVAASTYLTATNVRLLACVRVPVVAHSHAHRSTVGSCCRRRSVWRASCSAPPRCARRRRPPARARRWRARSTCTAPRRTTRSWRSSRAARATSTSSRGCRRTHTSARR